MRLICILLLCPLLTFGQIQDSCYSVNDFIETTNANNPPVTLDLFNGWNMVGYSCTHQVNVQDMFVNISDKIVIVKNNTGSVYLPEYGFNGLGDLMPNQGYQIKMTESVFGVEMCNYHINYHHLEGCTDCEAANFNNLATIDDGTCILLGCTDMMACNYNIKANQEDGNCVYAEPNYDCQGYCVNDDDLDGVCDELELMSAWEDCIIEPYENVNFVDNFVTPVMLRDSFLISISTQSAGAYIVAVTNEGLVVGSTYLSDNYILGDVAGMGIIADNTMTQVVDGALWGEPISFKLVDWMYVYDLGIPSVTMSGGIIVIDSPVTKTIDCKAIPYEACPYEDYIEYSDSAFSYNENVCQTLVVDGCRDFVAENYNVYANTDDGSCEYHNGCMDDTALNYDSGAVIDDGSCEYIYGCTEQEADNYNPEVTTNDGSCVYYGCTDTEAGNYDAIANTDDGSCLIGGCMNTTADNYYSDAEIDDGSCIIYGCTLTRFPNYNSVATKGDGSCDMNSTDVFGCTDESTWTYISIATIENGTCIYSDAKIGDKAQGGIVFYVDSNGQRGLVAALEDLTEGATDPSGWGFNGYEWGCFMESVNGADGQAIGTGYQNTLDVVNQGCSTYYGGITAAQAALDAEINGYSDWYLPSKDELEEMYNAIGNGGSEGDIGGFGSNWYWSSSEDYYEYAWGVSFSNGLAGLNYKNYTYRVRVIRAFGYNLGCKDETACNFNPEASMADGSCEYPELGYDCEGNFTEYIVGMQADGGIVFYVDSNGQRGLVAALEDLEGEYEWGYCEESVNGADGASIGTGYQNTLDIVNQGCTTDSGGITAAQAALDAEINDYSDWYLPSKDELTEIYNTIGNGGSDGNIGGFETDFSPYYWSSSEDDGNGAWYVSFSNGHTGYLSKSNPGRVRVIRAFGYTQGCMDETACNYNPEANMADGSCEYSELGFDCEGNEITSYQIGDLAQGGIVFYVDETGQHGLVAALEDIGGYEWGCYEESLNGADGQAIGTGYQNTLDVVNQECATQNGGVTAAQAALDAEINGYSDWYLPSIDELKKMYNTIGNGDSEGDIGGFGNNLYWSSSEYYDGYALGVTFTDGATYSYYKNYPSRVRVIRAF